jgi:methylated-DNA-[protein]-cysteine S-methyltransferase
MTSGNGRPLPLRRFRLATPIGVLVLLQDADGALRVLDWADHDERMHRLLRLHYGDGGFAIVDGAPGASPAVRALERYFAGDLGALDALSVATGGSPFQRGVWRALRDVPPGTTVSYAELARRVGRPTAFRAVGLANGANPIGVVVPCHRVVGSDGSLTGYGGGVERKRWLLAHEGALPAAPTAPPRARQHALPLR